ncbi:DNA topoisomerase [Acidithiobacillus sp. YTS05]|nr:DNA topoisomerase [Acidithiobacillus sp. YTS05]
MPFGSSEGSLPTRGAPRCRSYKGRHPLHLYEKKITTYPRTDCRYLPEEQLADAPKILQSLPISDAVRSLVNPRQKHATWNNGKITAHNAIVPTGERASGLSEKEAKLYELIWKSYVALFLPEYRYKALLVLVELGGETWKATGRQDLDHGWKRLYGKEAQSEEEGEEEGQAPLPLMQTGDSIQGQSGQVQARQTKPPARFTEGSLIDAMSNIHKFVTDPEARAKLKETSGLGTEATRASILETLFGRQYLQKKGKQLISTPKGRALIAYLERSNLGEFANPVTTARWEDLLSGVAAGRIPADRFVGAVTDTVTTAITKMKANGAGIATPAKTNGNGKGAKTLPCPICKGSATIKRLESKKKKGSYFWMCSNRDAHPLLADEKGKPGKPFGART